MTMTKNQKVLLSAAKEAQKQSYSPYSNFKVGAAVLSEEQSTYVGCNVENASYPLGQCAEASAISSMVCSGDRRIKEVMIVSPNESFCPPCGGCRQKILEFSSPDTVVHMATSEGKVKSVPLSDLLPLAFEI